MRKASFVLRHLIVSVVGTTYIYSGSEAINDLLHATHLIMLLDKIKNWYDKQALSYFNLTVDSQTTSTNTTYPFKEDQKYSAVL